MESQVDFIVQMTKLLQLSPPRIGVKCAFITDDTTRHLEQSLENVNTVLKIGNKNIDSSELPRHLPTLVSCVIGITFNGSKDNIELFDKTMKPVFKSSVIVIADEAMEELEVHRPVIHLHDDEKVSFA